jgi:hypothetical protein
MIRGIGDPLLAMYARAYFVRKSWDIDTTLKVCSKVCSTVSILYARAGTLTLFSPPHHAPHHPPGSHRAVFERQRGDTASAFTTLLAGKTSTLLLHILLQAASAFTALLADMPIIVLYYCIFYYRMRQLSQPY